MLEKQQLCPQPPAPAEQAYFWGSGLRQVMGFCTWRPGSILQVLSGAAPWEVSPSHVAAGQDPDEGRWPQVSTWPEALWSLRPQRSPGDAAEAPALTSQA